MAALSVVRDSESDDGGDHIRTIHRRNAEDAFREARQLAAKGDYEEFARMLSVQVRRRITPLDLMRYECGLGFMRADVLLAAVYLAGASVSDLIGAAPQQLDVLEARLRKLEEGQRVRPN